MENGRTLLRWMALAAWILIVTGAGMPLQAWADGKAGQAPLQRLEAVPPVPDLVLIKAVGQLKKLEMPPAVFLHDTHTRVLQQQGVDCTVCHTALASSEASPKVPSKAPSKAPLGVDDNPFAFKGTAQAQSAQKMEDQFHAGCLDCHAAMEAKDQKTGPQAGECRVCHNANPPRAAQDANAGMNKALHYKHISSKDIVFPTDAEKNCGVCHHVYDEAQKKLVWKEGKEDACAACHGAETQGATPSLQTASHTSCVQCHVQQNARNAAKSVVKDAALVLPGLPVTCEGCHGPGARDVVLGTSAGASAPGVSGSSASPATPSVLATPVIPDTAVPRLLRNQPDTVLFENDKRVGIGHAANLKTGVIFDHKGHEAVVDSCRVCHQHKTPGTGEGAFAFPKNFDWHDVNAEQSCIGCHQKRLMEQASCAGCHSEIKPLQRERSCGVCHVNVTDLVKDIQKVVQASPANADALERMAAKALDVMPAPMKPLAAADIPEKVSIGALSNEYEPALMPHRKIYEALVKGMGDSRLAATFHADKVSTCAACHHNSPVAGLYTPPKCSSCHNAIGDTHPVQDNKPSLKTAYHQQCMACHERMQVAPIATDCTGCHALRVTTGASSAGGKE